MSNGVYFGWAQVNGTGKGIRGCVANIGKSPTFIGQVRCYDSSFFPFSKYKMINLFNNVKYKHFSTFLYIFNNQENGINIVEVHILDFSPPLSTTADVAEIKWQDFYNQTLAVCLVGFLR